MIFSKILKNKSFLVYGLGLTGISAIKFLKKIGVKNIFIWDDNSETRKKYNLKYKKKNIKKRFSDVARNLTIFVEESQRNGIFKGIYIKEELNNSESKIIIASKGKLTKKNEDFKF